MPTPEDDGATWQAAFLDEARPLTARWRQQRFGARLLATAWVPVALLLVGVFIQRWTLIEWPGQGLLMLAVVPVWLAVLVVARLVERPAPAFLARAADALLGLDERMATGYEYARQPLPADPGAAALVRRQRLNALVALNDAREQMDAAFPLQPRRYQPLLAVAGGVLALLVAAIFLPSPFVPLRAERDALRTAVLQQATGLEQTRREAVARPQLPADLSALLDQQLHTATDRLRAAPDDRSSAVAALSQAEDRLRQELPPDAQQQAEAAAAAAPIIRAALPAGNRVSNPPDDLSDLGKAAYDAEQLADTIGDVLAGTSVQTADAQTAIRTLQRAAAALDSTDPALAAQLRAAAAALGKRDGAGAATALRAAAAGLRALDARQAANATLGQAIDQLAQARTTVAQAGLPAVANGTPGNRLGSLGRPGTLDAPGSTGASGAQGGDPTGAGTAAQPGQGSQPGAGDGSQPGAGNPTDSNPLGGNNSGPASTGGGGPGTRNGSANQGGTGTTASATPGAGTTSPPDVSPPGPEEKVYVPDPSQQAGAGAQGPQDTIPGQVQGGASGDSGSTTYRGEGVNPGVHTPYQDVIGQYSDSAASALDRTALPPDAKQYVRDYFSSLEPPAQTQK